MIGYEPDPGSIANYNTVIGIPTTMPFNTPLPVLNTVTTYYFRASFNFSGSTNGVSLIASNLVDDGLVIHLNGADVGRLRVAANQTATTQGGGGLTPEGQNEPLVLTNGVGNLRQGANVLAVEVHNAVSGSFDAAFGLKLIAIRPIQLAITDQPQDEAVVAGETATFTVGVSGGPVTYRWYRGNALQLSTSNTLNILNAQVANAGTNYYVVVSNVLNVVTSRLATLTVVSDTDGPKMLQAILNNSAPGGGPFPTNTVNVIFDEPMNATSVNNTNNYRLVSSTNSNIQIAIVRAQYTPFLGALLFVDASDANWNPAGSYYLLVNNLADDKGNNIDPNSVIGVSHLITTSLTQMGDLWDFYANAFFDPAWPGIYSQFHQTNFAQDPDYWGTGAGILWFDGFPTNTLCAGDTLGRQISSQDTIPTLFRRTFNLPAGMGSTATFRIRHMIDDGLVIYLNGVELVQARFNMPAGPITVDSRAIQTIENPTCSTNISLVVTNLLPGTNWLAAAVHQGPVSQNDIYFGFEMDAVTLNTSPAPTNTCLPGLSAPRLAYTRVLTNGGSHFVLSWPATNYGYALQYSTNIASDGPGFTHARKWWTNQANWFQVADQANPYTNMIPPTTGPRRFYRLYKLCQ